DMRDRRLQALSVETDLRVGEVAVVQQDERGALNADELGNFGDVAVDVDLDGVRAHEGAALEVVEVDDHAVRSDCGVIGGRPLRGGGAGRPGRGRAVGGGG